jgi:hypothetical protein
VPRIRRRALEEARVRSANAKFCLADVDCSQSFSHSRRSGSEEADGMKEGRRRRSKGHEHGRLERSLHGLAHIRRSSRDGSDSFRGRGPDDNRSKMHRLRHCSLGNHTAARMRRTPLRTRLGGWNQPIGGGSAVRLTLFFLFGDEGEG